MHLTERPQFTLHAARLVHRSLGQGASRITHTPSIHQMDPSVTYVTPLVDPYIMETTHFLPAVTEKPKITTRKSSNRGLLRCPPGGRPLGRRGEQALVNISLLQHTTFDRIRPYSTKFDQIRPNSTKFD